MSNFIIRDAVIGDSSTILKFVKELAIYEKAENEVIASVEDIEKTIFGENSSTHALICENDSVPVGFAVYFFNYSTWLGKNGIYLEDLYITPEKRGSGAGKTLLKHLAKKAVELKCGRFEWSVLDWNKPAIDFYKSVGAVPMEEWTIYRLEGNALLEFSQN